MNGSTSTLDKPLRAVRHIDWRSTPFVVFIVAAIIVIGGIFTLINNDRIYLELRRQEVRGQADVLAASVQAALDFQDQAAAQDAVSAFRVNKQVTWVGVFDATGTLLAAYARDGRSAPRHLKNLPSEELDIRVVVPVESDGQRVGFVSLQVQREALTRRVSRYVIWGALIVLAGLVLIVLGLSQTRMRRANRELELQAEALRSANVLLEEQMTVRAKAEEQLRQAQKMQALGQLTGGIAHDFNNLLTVIQGSADMLAKASVTEDKRVRYATAILQAATNASALTSQLLAFARRQPLKLERVDVNELIGSMRDLLDRTLGERIIVRTKLSTAECQVEADRNQLQSTILNIASNARDAMVQGGELLISTEVFDDEKKGALVALALQDTGSGMDAETRERVFEPFFTTKAAGKGTGLGLSQVYGFATQSGGEVKVSSVPGEGTTFTILLPCNCLPEEASQQVDPAPTIEGRCAKILVVEDNEQVGAFAETLLSELGHDVTLATSGEQALSLVHQIRYDVVFSDVVMPGMGGLALSRRLADEFPSLPVILATGYSEEILSGGAGDRPVLLKPYRLASLSKAIEEALGAARTSEAKA